MGQSDYAKRMSYLLCVSLIKRFLINFGGRITVIFMQQLPFQIKHDLMLLWHFPNLNADTITLRTAAALLPKSVSD